MKKSQLVEIIRVVVAEEVRKQLPSVVSEMYLKKLVSEASSHKHVKWEDSFDAELQRRSERIPEPMDNSHDGIYQDNPIVKRKNEVVGKLLSNENSLSSLYEGVTPIGQQAAGAASVPQTDVSLDALGLDPGMFKGMDFNKPSTNAPMKQSDASEERRIANLRASLDKKV